MPVNLLQLERAEHPGMAQYIERRGWKEDRDDLGRWRHEDGPDSYTVASLEAAYEIELGREKARLA